MSTAVKDPKHVAAGKASARARWGEHGRIVRIDSLTPEQAAIVRALVAAQEAANRGASAINADALEVRDATTPPRAA